MTSETANGLLVTQDVFFASKVTGTAHELGLQVEVVREPAQARSQVAEGRVRCVFVDLETPDLNLEEILQARPEAHRPTVIAYGPHVQTTRLEQARQAGCEEVLSRGQFSASLANILRRFLPG